MGIKGLTKLLADNAPKAMKEQKFESYFGRKIAIDASMSIYQFLIVVGRTGTETLTNEAGEVTSHLQGMFTRTIRLLESGMKPVYVFDGKPPDLKKQELAKRYSKRADATEDLAEAVEVHEYSVGNKEDIEKFSKRTVKVTKQHNEDCKRLLRLMGVPVVEVSLHMLLLKQRPNVLHFVNQTRHVYAVASEDMDSLTFGAPRFLRHLMDPSSKKKFLSWSLKLQSFFQILEELNLTMDQFIDLCILSGCDYCDSIRGIGGLTALKLIRQHGSIENILENINKDRFSEKVKDAVVLLENSILSHSCLDYHIDYETGSLWSFASQVTSLKLVSMHSSIAVVFLYQIPDDWPYQEARRLFKEPEVFTGEEQLDLKWVSPDEEGLITFLVNENGFNSDRVTKVCLLSVMAKISPAIEKIKAAKNKSSQGRLESFFKPVSNTSAPVKRKEPKCVLQSPKQAFKPRMFSLQACNSSMPNFTGSLRLPSLALGLKHSPPLSRGVCLQCMKLGEPPHLICTIPVTLYSFAEIKETPGNTPKETANKKSKAGGGGRKKK
ncbi:hypothetical protein Pint_21871 [Pistacia integerrima]|uniref:Uncharacterized protein n=1 Tax=Pistacia integerrima TaxID=434235 RepID=A0ACC0X8Z2_9ROSI|nr:hypothetical protein Pint_21871 [Pistacia integerrima]